MNDLSKLSQSLDQAGTPTDPAAIGGLTSAIERSGGLDGLVGQLRQGGLEGEVDSWISTGPNDPVDPQRLGEALGPDTVQQLSSGSGINIGSLLPMLAMFLPQIIDMLTKNGSTPAGGLDNAAGKGGMPDLGGLLGGVLGGALGGGGTNTGASRPGDISDISDLSRGLGDDSSR